ncbi:ABC transporter ATP-binding protein/permease [Desulfitobacterium chlororespirans]|uniref:ATP-binding cassette, subfamily B n=1 Tax=Desulfitobacterium chlororespirans DSM 11544 TaxID=1121395 RepID=A0A1M7SKE4_9FIRM|nr:ABC transporter ATP-binding protein [Desulfitobacterium chlororespirans]SHN58963.1 ATP-binding cassette, subfamily B [Desulfitobacterium chlororespirans DSM 11544]
MLISKRLFAITRGMRGSVVLKVVIGVLVTGTYIIQGVLTAMVLSRVFAGEAWEQFIVNFAVILGMILLRSVFNWFNEVQSKKLAGQAKEKLRYTMFEKLLTLGPGFLQNNRSGSIQSVFVDGVEAIGPYISYYIPHCFVTLISSLGILAYVFYLHTMVGAIMLLGMIIVMVVPSLWIKVMRSTGMTSWEKRNHFNAQFLDALQGMMTLKAFNASEAKGKELENDSREWYKSIMHNLAVSLLDSCLIGLGAALGSAFSVGVAAYLFALGQLSLTGMFLILFLSVECFRPMTDLVKYWHVGFRGLTAADKIFVFLDTRPQIAEPEDAPPLAKAGFHGDVVFDKVTFGYNQGTRPALAKATFTISQGEKVAVVGKSGAGKSTLVNLLLRFFDPQEGSVRISGRDLKTVPSRSFHELISVVWQDTYLFHGTIAENLRIAKPGAGHEEIEKAAKLANIHDFIVSLPEGYATQVGERGVRFSGGERQRIAVARAFLKDAPILVLDEATSSLDAENEAAIQQGLQHLMENRTVLIIAHRFSTIREADRIIVLEDHKIVQTGTHDELMAKGKGQYAQLLTAQL